MSRCGNKPISVPSGVAVSKQGNRIQVKGPKGNLELQVMDFIDIHQAEQELQVKAASVDDQAVNVGAFHGLYRALIQNMVTGVTAGWEKKLQLIGVGYRANVVGQRVEMQLGYSHPVILPIPAGITVAVDKTSTSITVNGSDRQMVGQFAALLRQQRKPEPYKGKGVRYEGEFVRKKEGKSGKSGKGK
ncbi:MAG: 50S ribosomal protein L6 [Chlamydiia bacterium]